MKKNIQTGVDPDIKLPVAELWDIDRLVPYGKNARIHSDVQIKNLMRLIREFGFVAPIVVDKKDVEIVAGHGRRLAAIALGMPKVPVIACDHLTEEQKRSLRLADNQVAAASEWDVDLLREEMLDLEQLGVDLSTFAFDEEELSAILAPAQGSTKAEKDPDAVPAVPTDPTSRLGDLWVLGNHRLLCGDCLDRPAVVRLMAGASAALVWTDPPYNVAYTGYTEEKLSIANDAMSDADFRQFLRNVFRAYRAAMKQTASIYVCHPSSYQRAFESAMEVAGLEVRCQIIWAKNTFAWGHGRYKFQHEPIFYGCVAGQSDAWYGDKSQSTLWQENKPSANRIHPTAKPVELVIRALENSSQPGDLVLDFFGGSGSTLIACEQTLRTCYLTEIDPKYVDRIILRWQEFTGMDAALEDGTKFSDVVRSRRRKKPAA